jgi:hypothetical protein
MGGAKNPGGVMRRARHLLWILALAALAAAPAYATSVTVQITGTWSSVTDNANVFGGSVGIGTSFSATLIYDDATADGDPDPNVGSFSVAAAASDLSITTSSFVFTPGGSAPLAMAVENDNAFGEDTVFLFADGYTASGLPLGISLTGTRYANPTLTDTSATAHVSGALTGLPWSIGSYDISSFYFFSQIAGAGANKFIELQGTVTELTLLPEPSTAFLCILAGLAIAAARIRV